MSRKTGLPADALREIFHFTSRRQLDTLVAVNSQFNRLIATSHKPIRLYTVSIGASTQPAGGFIVGVHDMESQRGEFFRADNSLTQLLPLLSRKWTRFKELSVTLGPKRENNEWLESLASYAHCLNGVKRMAIRLSPQSCSIAYARILDELVPKAELVKIAIQDGHPLALGKNPFAFAALKNAKFAIIQAARWDGAGLRINDEYIVDWLFSPALHHGPGRATFISADAGGSNRLAIAVKERFLRDAHPCPFFCELRQPLTYADQLAQMAEVRVANESTGEELHIRLKGGFESTLLMSRLPIDN